MASEGDAQSSISWPLYCLIGIFSKRNLSIDSSCQKREAKWRRQVKAMINLWYARPFFGIFAMSNLFIDLAKKERLSGDGKWGQWSIFDDLRGCCYCCWSFIAWLEFHSRVTYILILPNKRGKLCLVFYGMASYSCRPAKWTLKLNKFLHLFF